MEKKTQSKVSKKSNPVQKQKVSRTKIMGVKSRVKAAPLKQKTAVAMMKNQGKSRPAPIPEPGFAMYSTDSEEAFSFSNEKDTCAKVLTMLRKKSRDVQPTPGYVSAMSILGNTPFNNRLASSTPDPDRPQIIPERDTNSTNVVPYEAYSIGTTTLDIQKERYFQRMNDQFFSSHGPKSVIPHSGNGVYISPSQGFQVTNNDQNEAKGLDKRDSDIGAFQAYIPRESTGFSTVPVNAAGNMPEHVCATQGNNQSGSSGDKSRTSLLQTTGNSSGTEYIYLPRPVANSDIDDRNIPPGFQFQNGLYQIRPHGPMTAGAPGEERQIHNAQLIPVTSTSTNPPNQAHLHSNHRSHNNYIWEIPERDDSGPLKSPRRGHVIKDTVPDTISTIDGSVSGTNTFQNLTPRSTVSESSNTFPPANESKGQSFNEKSKVTADLKTRQNVKGAKGNSLLNDCSENTTGSFQTQSSKFSAENAGGCNGTSSAGTLYHLIHTDKGKELVPVSLVHYPSLAHIPGPEHHDGKGQCHNTSSQGHVPPNIDIPVSVLTSEAELAGLTHQSSAVKRQDSVAGQPNPWSGVRLDAGMKRVRYLLGEMKECGKINKDIEIGRLAKEIEKSLDSTPQLSATFSLQAEIDLALQPLRNENAQLRRKLRLANQNVRDHEHEKEKATVGVNFDVLHLQASNSGLQRQVKEEMEDKVKLASEVANQHNEIQRLKVERNKLLAALSEKETDELKVKQECLADAQQFRKEVEAMNRQIEAIQLQQEASDQENHILHVSLEQRDIEISRLQDTVQEMKTSVSELIQELDHVGDRSFTSNNSFGLQKLLQVLGGEQQISRPPRGILTPAKSQNTQKFQGSGGPVKSLRFDPREMESFARPAKLTEQALASHNRSLEREQNKGNNSDTEVDFTLNEYVGTKGKVLPRQRRRSSSPQGRQQSKENSRRRALSSSPRQVERLSLIGSELKEGDKSLVDTFAAQRMVKTSDDKRRKQCDEQGSQNRVGYHGNGSGHQRIQASNFDSNLSDAEQSRYSVTDYFQKYHTPPANDDRGHSSHSWSSHKRALSQPAGLVLGRTGQPTLHSDKHPVDYSATRFTNSQREKSNWKHIPATTFGMQQRSPIDSQEKSAQDRLYRGTTLDVSISAIDDDNFSSVSSSEKTLSTSSTITDKTFRKGIATLDANILKLQLALQRTKSMLS
ncbi:uncharacterized protein LOC110463018 isoform X2 [Mizuhopecten yessoensis]|uniref:uncharacterized protein LOC110463018 isoform X2 n=1 Tax=Mizuhopecten yessoensis TaxID=6573 RepID=UPI000B45A8E0|nr:uncharacterized protein LOC110463018 isoform X2 [Mizuhopecten yessoensis]